MMHWLILLVSVIIGGGFGGYSTGGKNTLSIGNRGSTLGGDGVSCYSTLVDTEVVPPGGDYGCSGPTEMHAQWVQLV